MNFDPEKDLINVTNPVDAYDLNSSAVSFLPSDVATVNWNDLNQLINKAYKTACDKGWYDSNDYKDIRHERIPQDLLMIADEIFEALHDYRNGCMNIEIDANGKPNGFPIEISDVIIRLLGLIGYHGLDIHNALQLKMDYNDTRPWRHGGKII